MKLNISHFTMNELYTNYRQTIDLTYVSHVDVNSEWIPVKEYIKLIYKITPVTNRIVSYLYPNLVPVYIIPSYRIRRIKESGVIKLPTIHSRAQKRLDPSSAENHFTISSFALRNVPQMKEVISNIWNHRDKHSSLHFHLEGNGGGHMVGVIIILLLLCGGKQRWMTEYGNAFRDEDGTIKTNHYDAWNLETMWGDSIDEFKLPSKTIPYTKPYSGKIVLYMDTACGSSTWYFITYIIYAFAESIERSGTVLKLGRATGKQIELHGTSSTCSGDGNAIDKEFEIDDKMITCEFPTIMKIACPIKNRDWNRCWMES